MESSLRSSTTPFFYNQNNSGWRATEWQWQGSAHPKTHLIGVLELGVDFLLCQPPSSTPAIPRPKRSIFCVGMPTCNLHSHEPWKTATQDCCVTCIAPIPQWMHLPALQRELSTNHLCHKPSSATGTVRQICRVWQVWVNAIWRGNRNRTNNKRTVITIWNAVAIHYQVITDRHR